MNNKHALLAMIAVGLLGVVVGAMTMVLFGPAFFHGRATEAEVRHILRTNPDIVLEALQALTASEEEFRAEARDLLGVVVR